MYEILEGPYVVYDDPLAGAVCPSSVSAFHAKQHKTEWPVVWECTQVFWDYKLQVTIGTDLRGPGET